MEIVEVHPDEAELFEAWHAAYAEAAAYGRGKSADVWQLPELAAELSTPSRQYRKLAYAGLSDGVVVTTGQVWLPLLDNLQRAELEIHTRPAVRRQGYGSAMLEHLAGVATAAGRTILGSEARWPYDGGTDEQRAGVHFARAHGFDLVLEDVQRTLRLPVPDARLDELAAAAAERHPSYRLQAWVGGVPEELLTGWAELSASLETEAPTGDLAIEPAAVDLEAVREAEALQAKQGRVSVHAVALGTDGSVVAYSHLVVPEHEPDRAYQWGTLVRAADRGHRLGLAVKVSALRLLQQRFPRVERILTWNAETNRHMIAVNELLGFVPTERLGELQKVVRK